MNNRVEIRPGRHINITVHANPTSNATAFLIHGLGGRGEQWREQINALKDKFTLIIPDLLGHGKSDKPVPGAANPYRFSANVDDLQVIFNRYASDNNVVMGHSYGATLAVALTLDHQDKINKLVLLSPKPCVPDAGLPWMFNLPAFAMECLRPWMDKHFQQLGFTPSANPALLAEELKAGLANHMYVIKAVMHGMSEIPAIDLTLLTIPTLIIIGEQDGIIPAPIQRGFFQAIPHHQFERIDPASHMLLLENSAVVNKIISEFLTSDNVQ